MRVCLINPPRIQPKLWGKPSIFQPLDLAYIAAVLERDHEVKIIDAANEEWKNLEVIDGTKYRQGLRNEDILQRLREWSPEIVGITIPFSGWCKTAYEIASLIKKENESIVTIFSGLHPSARPNDCLSSGNIDFVIIGEPEFTYQELVEVLDDGHKRRLEKIKGIGYIKDSRQFITSPRPFIHDLDSLPFPARHLLPMETYFSAVKEKSLRGEISKPWATIITSRGCPHECIFCSVHTLMGKEWRGRSPENVVEEIKDLVQRYKIEQIDFNDENLTFDSKRIEKMVGIYI